MDEVTAAAAMVSSKELEKMRVIGALKKLLTSSSLQSMTSQTGAAAVSSNSYKRRLRRECSWAGYTTRGYELQQKVGASMPLAPHQLGRPPPPQSAGGSEKEGHGRAAALPDVNTNRGRAAIEKIIKHKDRDNNLSDCSEKPILDSVHGRRQFAQTLRMLKLRRIESVKLSSNQLNNTVKFHGELEIDGLSVKDNQDSASTISTPSDHSEPNLNTKHRLRVGDADERRNTTPTTGKVKKTPIIIPCHTDVECEYCQLYDGRPVTPHTHCHGKTTLATASADREKGLRQRVTHSAPIKDTQETFESPQLSKLNSPRKLTKSTQSNKEIRKSTLASLKKSGNMQVPLSNSANIVSLLLNKSDEEMQKEDNSQTPDNLLETNDTNSNMDRDERNTNNHENTTHEATPRLTYRLCYTKATNPVMKTNAITIGDLLMHPS